MIMRKSLPILAAIVCSTASLPLMAGVPANYPKSTAKHLSLGLTGNQYFVKDSAQQPLPDRRTSNFGLNFDWRTYTEGNTFSALLDTDALLGISDSNYRYINVSEAYIGSSPSLWETFHLYAGRKVESWSELDDYWSLGIFQPRFRWDYLNEYNNGLTGFFASIKNEYLEFIGFASPIFIPEQGAPLNISDGDCNSSSPWFYCPSSSINLFNQPTNVTFQLEIPPIRKLISYAGVATSLKLGKKYGFYWKNSFAYKPINQLLLSYVGQLDLSTQELPTVIHPRILYHKTYSSDLGYKKDSWHSVLSFMHENPIRDFTPVNWNNQEISKTTLVGGNISKRIFGEKITATTIELAYLHRKGGLAPNTGPFANISASVFESRFAFENAYSFLLRTPIMQSWASYFHSTIRFILDTNNDGNILMSDLLFTPTANFHFNIGFDILGSNSQSAVDFISRYQRNDRLRGGLYYYF